MRPLNIAAGVKPSSRGVLLNCMSLSLNLSLYTPPFLLRSIWQFATPDSAWPLVQGAPGHDLRCSMLCWRHHWWNSDPNCGPPSLRSTPGYPGTAEHARTNAMAALGVSDISGGETNMNPEYLSVRAMNFFPLLVTRSMLACCQGYVALIGSSGSACWCF